MEKRINSKVTEWVETFKAGIRGQILGAEAADTITAPGAAGLLQYMYAYPHLTFSKEDLSRRQRIKNVVPYHDRCHARRADSGQCTRRKKTDGSFCGTHAKGTPHGVIEDLSQAATLRKVTICAHDIEGIISHVDAVGNIYDPQDIYQNVKNPRVIARCQQQADGTYTLLP